jgi:hypothetical protein
MNKYTSQIGGKGSMRIKSKKKKLNINKQSINYKTYIDTINKKLLSLNKQNYITFEIIFKNLVEECFRKIKRIDINKSNGLKYSDINKQGLEYIYEIFFYKVNDYKLLLKSDIYNYIEQNFKNSGKKIIFELVESIDSILVKKEYSIDIESNKYNCEEFKRGLEYFELDASDKIHFKKIKDKYTEYIKNSDIHDINNTNMYFTLLKNQYNDYLKSY